MTQHGQWNMSSTPYPQEQPSGQSMPSQRAAPRPEKKRKWPWMIAIAAVLIIAVGSQAGGDDDTTASAGSTGSAAQSNDEDSADAEQAEATIGQPVRDGKFEFVITEISRAKTVGGEHVNETAQGEYVIVHLTVTNVGDEPQLLSDSSQYLYDAEGRKYSADSLAGLYLSGDGGDSVWLEEINPGNTVKVKMAFDMPAGAEPVRAALHDSAFSGGVTVTLT